MGEGGCSNILKVEVAGMWDCILEDNLFKGRGSTMGDNSCELGQRIRGALDSIKPLRVKSVESN